MAAFSFDFYIGSLACQAVRLLAEQTRPEQSDSPLLNHRHPSWELHYLFRGSLTLVAGPHTHKVEAGQLLLIPPATYHYMASTSEDFDSMTIPFSLARGKNAPISANDKQLLEVFQPSSPILVTEASKPLVFALKQLRRAAQEDPDPYMQTERLRHLCPLALLELARQLSEHRHTTTAKPTNIPYLYYMEDYFATHYNLNPTRQELAKRLHISQRQLNRVLQKHYGMTFQEKVQEFRLKNAMELLQTTTLPLHTVAERLGFSSPSSFSAFIRSATGRTPSQLRNERQQS